MKKSIIFLFAALFSLSGYSQVRFGIKAGGTTSMVPVYDLTFGSVGIEPAHKWGFGFHAGPFLSITTESVYLQPELFFESDTYEYTVVTNYATEIVRQRINRLVLPLLFGVDLDGMHIFLGPSPAVKIGMPEALVDDPDYSKLFDKVSLEYQAGLGISIVDKIDVGIRYKGYLGKNFEGIEKVGNQTFTLNKSNSSIMVSIGYLF